jgi:hypothetical protein
VLTIICIGGYIKDKRSRIISNIVIMWGPIEFISYLV